MLVSDTDVSYTSVVSDHTTSAPNVLNVSIRLVVYARCRVDRLVKDKQTTTANSYSSRYIQITCNKTLT